MVPHLEHLVATRKQKDFKEGGTKGISMCDPVRIVAWGIRSSLGLKPIGRGCIVGGGPFLRTPGTLLMGRKKENQVGEGETTAKEFLLQKATQSTDRLWGGFGGGKRSEPYQGST